MLWVVTFVGQLWFGLEVACWLFASDLPIFGVFAAAVPLGVCLSSFAFLLLSALFGSTWAHFAGHTAALVLASAALCRRRVRAGRRFRYRILHIGPHLISCSFGLVFIFPVYVNPPGTYLTVITRALHEELALAASFRFGVNSAGGFLRFAHPDFFGAPVVTRWLTAYHMAMLSLGAGSFQAIALFTTWVFFSAFLVAMNVLADEFHVPVLMTPLVGLIPMLTSGFGLFEWLASGRKRGHATDFVSDIGVKTNRLNPLWDIVVGNRPMLFALPLSCLVLVLLFHLSFCRDRGHAVFLSRIAGFLLGGVCPAVQHQAFASLLVFALFHCLIQITRQPFCHVWLNLFGTCALSFAVMHFHRYANADFLKTFQWVPVWQAELAHGAFFPIVRHFFNIGGLFPFICLATPWIYLSIIERQFFLAFVCTTVVFSYWKLQLRPQDNILAFYPFMHTLGAAFTMLVTYRIIKGQPRPDRKGLLIGVAVALAVTGWASAIAGFRALLSWTDCWSPNDAPVAQWIRENTPVDAVFFYQPRPLHYVAVLTGRQTFVGDAEVVAMEGISIESRTAEVQAWQTDVSPVIDYVVAEVGAAGLMALNYSASWRMVWEGKQRLIFKRIRTP